MGQGHKFDGYWMPSPSFLFFSIFILERKVLETTLLLESSAELYGFKNSGCHMHEKGIPQTSVPHPHEIRQKESVNLAFHESSLSPHPLN